ncbi:molybdopterin molybdotransferase MoeA [Methyloceanibacter caenitepidi]|uniref:Molybdopterin molybdenumtransferase n=1 Tax=Methyloceanibacter caenitepidi TaxID=1384459 RepID=A0A0A8K6S2_9HYPH|nr:molybdopterin molybdotransferase MoeA [Methyloceanibacter caenitepidi]BAQ18648.1 molybdopterin biosynthesis protein MoeA [Methyloceanibacter caenitepidi]
MTQAKLIDDCFVLDKDRLPHHEAIEILKSRVRPVTGTESVSVAEANGRFLAEAVVSPRAIPGHDNAAVDGYAFASREYDPKAGTDFDIVGEAMAGHPFQGSVPQGAAVRIFTGAVIPAGLDTVAMQEDVQVSARESSRRAHVPAGLKAGANRRLAGEDTKAGEMLLAPGRRLRPQDVASAAATGLGALLCHAPLKVAVFSTGDEVLRPGDPFVDGAVYDANAPMLQGLISASGAQAVDMGVLPDTPEAVTSALAKASRDFHVIVLSGGASQGQEDHVVRSIDALGKRHLWQIAIKPGRPMSFGQICDCVVLGLPGNPVAVFVCYLIYVRPFVTRLAGGAWPEPVRFPVPAAFSQRKKPGRREFWRAMLARENGKLVATKFPRDGSGLISSLRESDGLIELGEDVESVGNGDLVDFIPFAEFDLGQRQTGLECLKAKGDS